MRAFLCEVDHAGLRRLLSEEAVRGDAAQLRLWARTATSWAAVWALLDDNAIRAEVSADSPGDACGLLLNRAIEPLPVAAALSGSAPPA
jgi:hypothetical protein